MNGLTADDRALPRLEHRIATGRALAAAVRTVGAGRRHTALAHRLAI